MFYSQHINKIGPIYNPNISNRNSFYSSDITNSLSARKNINQYSSNE